MSDQVRMFEVDLRHDHGVYRVTINARDLLHAVDQVLSIELAPRRSVIRVKEV